MKTIKFLSITTLFSALLMIGCQQDDIGIAPAVTLSNPANNSVGVAIAEPIVISFSEAMDPATINDSSFTLINNRGPVAGTVTYGSLKATFTPTSLMLPNNTYTVTITTEMKTQSGRVLAVGRTFTFTTADRIIVSPTIAMTDPLNNMTGIPRNKAITIQFSEAMDSATISKTNFNVREGSILVPGSVRYAGTTATFVPSTAFSALTRYTATITTGAKDLTGDSLAINSSWHFTTGGNQSTLAAIDLGESANYVILAKTGISNISTSAITGDMGLSPAAGSYVTGFSLTDGAGFATSAQVTGRIYAADMTTPTPINLTTAIANMTNAYNDAAQRSSPDFVELAEGSIGGRTLVPGVYQWTNAVSISKDITIEGGPNDIWIFQIPGNLSVSAAVNMKLLGGAQANNIFWQVGQATLETEVHFEGTILSRTGIILQTGASITGRALAQTAVVLDTNAISNP